MSLSSIDRPSFLYVLDRNQETPLYLIKVEMTEYRRSADNKVVPRTIVKTHYCVHDPCDAVLKSTSHTLYLMSKELGERADFSE